MHILYAVADLGISDGGGGEFFKIPKFYRPGAVIFKPDGGGAEPAGDQLSLCQITVFKPNGGGGRPPLRPPPKSATDYMLLFGYIIVAYYLLFIYISCCTSVPSAYFAFVMHASKAFYFLVPLRSVGELPTDFIFVCFVFYLLNYAFPTITLYVN